MSTRTNIPPTGSEISAHSQVDLKLCFIFCTHQNLARNSHRMSLWSSGFVASQTAME